MDWPFGDLPKHRFGVVLCDPPWTFTTRSPKGWGKSPQHHYRTMSQDELRRLPVADLAAPDCAMVMWATAPHLPQALTLMGLWGFTFKSAGAWAKRTKTDSTWQFGTGYILRSAAEFFLIGTRGEPRTTSKSVRNLIVAPVGRHSEKPPQMHALCEALWPAARKVELFARARVPNFDVWGDQLDEQEEEAAHEAGARHPDHGAAAAAR